MMVTCNLSPYLTQLSGTQPNAQEINHVINDNSILTPQNVVLLIT